MWNFWANKIDTALEHGLNEHADQINDAMWELIDMVLEYIINIYNSGNMELATRLLFQIPQIRTHPEWWADFMFDKLIEGGIYAEFFARSKVADLLDLAIALPGNEAGQRIFRLGLENSSLPIQKYNDIISTLKENERDIDLAPNIVRERQRMIIDFMDENAAREIRKSRSANIIHRRGLDAYYRPGAPGAIEAQEHFEMLRQQRDYR